MKTIRVALAGAACMAIAVPAVALAASPVKGGTYSNQVDLSFATVSASGKSAKLEVYPGKCNNGIPLQATKPAKIAGGKVTYNAAAKALGSANGAAHLTVSGKFVSSKSLTWTVHAKVGACTSSNTETLTLTKS